MGKGKAEPHRVLLELREGFLKDLRDMKDPDRDSELIIKAKVVAIGQALDALGYKEEDGDDGPSC